MATFRSAGLTFTQNCLHAMRDMLQVYIVKVRYRTGTKAK